MDRKGFIKNCGFACLGGGLVIGALFESCTPVKILSGDIAGDELLVSLADFEISKGTEKQYRKYLVVNNEMLQYPVYVYRFHENEYAALWMKCTHQGAELQVFGDKLQCPAHGSEFNNKGEVQNGPADMRLRSFPITIERNQIKISLKAV